MATEEWQAANSPAAHQFRTPKCWATPFTTPIEETTNDAGVQHVQWLKHMGFDEFDQLHRSLRQHGIGFRNRGDQNASDPTGIGFRVPKISVGP